jgi:phage repressor protein C with HTH and peptisase S24 domain
MKSYKLLEEFASDEDLEYYKTLYALHYASETEKFDRSYIGDAILVLAHKLISASSEHKDAILKAITYPNSSLLDCEYENNLFNAQDHSASIDELKAMVKSSNKTSVIDSIATAFANKKDEFFKKDDAAIVADDIEGKQMAYYAGAVQGKRDSINEKILQTGSKVITFSRQNRLSGLSIIEDNKTLALTKAATTLLDALDSSAQVLVVEEKDVYNMFKKNFANMEKTLGRDISLKLILAEDFLAKSVLEAA